LKHSLDLSPLFHRANHPPAPTHRLSGDFGFDPLNLGTDPQALKWYVQAELVHARTAMTAVAGILIPGVSKKWDSFTATV
jgi:hypothetical protein